MTAFLHEVPLRPAILSELSRLERAVLPGDP